MNLDRAARAVLGFRRTPLFNHLARRQLGDDVVEAGPGDLVYKPRGQWHTFWNAGDEPARILEIISPAGFEQFFAELAPLASGGAPDPDAFGELCGRYELDMQPKSVPGLCSRFGVWFPGVE
jgi:Cupin domain